MTPPVLRPSGTSACGLGSVRAHSPKNSTSNSNICACEQALPPHVCEAFLPPHPLARHALMSDRLHYCGHCGSALTGRLRDAPEPTGVNIGVCDRCGGRFGCLTGRPAPPCWSSSPCLRAIGYCCCVADSSPTEIGGRHRAALSNMANHSRRLRFVRSGRRYESESMRRN